MPTNSPTAGRITIYSAFSWLWGASEMLCVIRFPEASISSALLYCGCIAVLLRPASLWALILLASAGIVDYTIKAPVTSNFRTLCALVDITILAAAIYARLKWGAGRVDLSRVLEIIRPLLLLYVCGAYGFSVLHKLNHAFFDPEISYAVYWLNQIKNGDYPWYLDGFSQLVPHSSTWMNNLVIYWTLLIEALIPLLLLFKRTRLAGIALDFVFHLMMGYRMYPPSTNFPAAMMALLMLAFPIGAGDYLEQLRQNKWLQKMPCSRRIWKIVSILIAILLFPLFFGAPEDERHVIRELFRASYWNICVVIYAGLLLSYWKWSVKKLHLPGPGIEGEVCWRGLRHPLALLSIFLFIFNGLAPHLGLKTRASFEVFSGLDTYNKKTNHLFIPQSWQIFDNLEDMITLRDAAPGSPLEIGARLRIMMPYVEFERLALRYPDEPLTYKHGSKTLAVKRLGDIASPEKLKYSWLERKFLATHSLSKREWENLHGIVRHAKKNPAR